MFIQSKATLSHKRGQIKNFSRRKSELNILYLVELYTYTSRKINLTFAKNAEK